MFLVTINRSLSDACNVGEQMGRRSPARPEHS